MFCVLPKRLVVPLALSFGHGHVCLTKVGERCGRLAAPSINGYLQVELCQPDHPTQSGQQFPLPLSVATASGRTALWAAVSHCRHSQMTCWSLLSMCQVLQQERDETSRVSAVSAVSAVGTCGSEK